jgi:uncharacterized repeat protein (TIGR01451 family)
VRSSHSLRPVQPGRRRWAALVATAALAVPLLTVASPLTSANAVLPGSTFEGNDGNLLVTTSGNTDWQNAPNFAMGTDKTSGKNDDSFSGGIDEDTVNPTLATGAIPNSKDDLARFYAGFEKVSSGARMLYLAWIRNKTSGSADMDFELNQSTATTSDGLPVRTPGDVLVTYEFVSTKTPDIRIQRWITSGSGCVTASAPPCWANRMTLTAPQAEAMVNDGFTTPDPRFLTAGKPTTLASQTFGEAAINLTSLGIFSDTGPCTRFARAFAKTRSSQSFNSSMQDLITPIPIDFSNCVTKSFDISVAGGVPSGTSLYAVYTKGTATTPTAIQLTPGAAGHLTGSDASVTPGTTLNNLHLELRNADGTVAWQNANQNETITQATSNTGTFSYTVSLSPASAENFVGRPHVLTATVLGSGSLNNTGTTTNAPLKGVTVGFRLESGTPTGCGSLSPLSATTNAQGQAQTTLSSGTACSTTIRAFVDRAGSTSGYETGDPTGTATKTFVAYALSVSPASATNELGKPHTFTVTLTRNTGSGAVGYGGQSVGFSLADPDNTGAYVESVNGTATNSTSVKSGTCTTSTAGQCTIVTRAPRTGTFTLNVSYTTSNASGQGTFTGSGTKTFEDYRISVTPTTATNQLNVPHTFTVLLEKSTNNTWAPLSGASVGLALTKTAGDAAITSINGVSGSGTSCTTRTDGTCSVVINATQPGQVTLTATYSKALDSGTVTRSASGTKQYSAFSLTVTPTSATNDMQHPQHTFTVTLKRNDGSGFVGYAGQTVSLSLAPGTSGATITSINGVSGSGTSCTTQSDGTCIVVITATAPGQAVLTASWSKALSATETATQTASGSKQYSDFSLDVTPESATNDMQHPEHTFTVTLKRNDGSGFVGYAGQTVTLSLDPGTSGATITSINGVSGSGTSCVTRSDGTCSVVILASSPGRAVLSAGWSKLLDSGTTTRSDSGAKQYSDFRLTVTPLDAINNPGEPHTFTVTLTRNNGTGFQPYANQPVSLSLAPGASSAHFTAINGSSASGTTGSCTTRTDGTCSVTINSATPGTVVLTATWSEVLSSSDTASLTASGTKRYIAVSAVKTSCAANVPPGGLVAFDIPWSTAGSPLTNAKITDTLPAGLTFVPAGSTPPTSVSGQTLTFNLANPLPDPSSGTIHIVTLVGSSVPLGTVLTNTGAFTADGGVNKPFSSSITVTNQGAAASGRAYGLTASLGGSTLLAPTPDTDKKNPDSVLTIGIPPLAPTVLSGTVGVVPVQNNRTVDATHAEDEAVATVADVNLVVAGVPVTAKVVSARSDSTATGSSAQSSMDGSQVVGLKVGTGVAQDYSNPTVVPVVNLLGVKVAEIAVLEQVGRSGAAVGGSAGAQPQNGLFNSGLGVNGLHVRLLDGTADVIVAHADSKAAFPTLSPCALAGGYVVGSAFVANEVLDYPTGPTTVSVVPVTLGSAGGSQSGAANALDLAVIGATSGTGTADTAGTLDPAKVDSDAAVQKLVVKNGASTALSATLVQAHASANGSPSGTTIAKLVIGGTDVCAALGLTATCTPAPNTKLLDLSKTLTIVLNEQLSNSGVLTVNAVHIFVLGAGNPLGLPVGSDLIISSATAGIGS